MTDLAPPSLRRWLDAAIAEAENGREAGGIPIGSVLVLDGEIIASELR